MKQQRVSSKVASHTRKNVFNYIHLNVWDQPQYLQTDVCIIFINFISDLKEDLGLFYEACVKGFTFFMQWKVHVKN